MGQKIDPSQVAQQFREEISKEVGALDTPLTLVGLLAEEAGGPSKTYAEYTRRGCEDVGIRFDLRVRNRFRMEAEIHDANQDPNVHGIIIYYPIFELEQDNYIKDLVSSAKDIEGLSTYWLRRLYENIRFTDEERQQKAILPCTPLAIMKLLDAAGALTKTPKPFAGKTVTIFNRSEVVGRPLASMLANDGAEVFSFDIHGPIHMVGEDQTETNISRRDALQKSNIVITGVPSREFELIKPEEVRDDTIGVNFSTVKNFSVEAKDKVGVFVPRVGPMTVTMVLRNTLRLYKNYHGQHATTDD